MKKTVLGVVWLFAVGFGAAADEPKTDEVQKKAVDKALETFAGTWEIVAVRPTAVKSCVWFCCSVMTWGAMRNWVSGEIGPVIATGRSQPSAATAASAAAGAKATRSFRRASRHDSLCMKVMALGGYGVRGGTDNPPCSERARRRYRPLLWSTRDGATA